MRNEFKNKLYDELLEGFVRHFAYQDRPIIEEMTSSAIRDLALNNPFIRCKADSLTASVMHVLDKHIDPILEENHSLRKVVNHD